jgi:xylulokinase
MGVVLSAAASLEWLASLLRSDAPRLTNALGKSLAGPSSCLFLPYLSGERTPVADARIRGLMMGLGHETDARALTHAVLDGVAFAFRDSLEALKAAGTVVGRVAAVGGGSRSHLWLKIIATVLDLPVDVPTDGDFGGAFGAARLGLIAATGADFASVCTAPRIAVTVKPEARAREAYAEAYARYVQIYPSIRDI